MVWGVLLMWNSGRKKSLLLLCLVGLCAVSSSADDVLTVAGNGEETPLQLNGSATAVAVAQPFGLTTGPDGALYVCEVGLHVIRRIDLQSGESRVVAGSGRSGWSGDGGPALQASLNEPYEIRFDSRGNMIFVEMKNHLVRRVDASTGIISTIAGDGKPGFSGDGGPATEAQLKQPHSIALDKADNIYICDIGNHRIRMVDSASGMIRTFAGTGERAVTPDGAALEGTPLNGPRALDFDGGQSLFLALREGNALYRIDLEKRTLHHLAGNGRSGYSGDGGPARDAALSGPKGVAIAANGDVYFADTESHTVRVWRQAAQIVETVVGNGQRGDGPDGAAEQCLMDRPHGVFVSKDGRLFIGDSNNHRVRMLKIAR